MRVFGKLFVLFLNASGQKKKKESKETFGPVSAGFTVDESVASVWKFPQNFDYDSDRRVIVASTRGQHQCSKVPIPELECKGCEAGFPKYDRPCDKPNSDEKAKYKCKVLCGPGFEVKSGLPRKMKCLGTPRRWKVDPRKFNGKIKCVPKSS
ncbi:Oidioi.mRNA.OKI2018_I69.XSR.g15851.t1.cds [Oikopleura dioica]|uniref:Oidioi.mRNA.OKI2018_I69.XSR.g15851.t1.cds n=1 Tax=Oikopleura dioica TaxID=34765 RepID=A0ABN7SIE1_OIKDI|nr:Oidioi.mRNA.OKI2018_I69.XSR.g15851.t1.cds [Oikopleura dioica]